MNTIRSLRQSRGWTQFELALRVGVQPQAVYFWESGRRTPQVPQLRKLGEIFEICSDDIVLESGPEPARTTHKARTNRRPGEPAPGRDRAGRVTSRRREPTTSNRDEP